MAPTSTEEHALAALELLCTAAGDASALPRKAPVVPVRACAMEGLSGRGHECAIGILAAIYDGEAMDAWWARCRASTARVVGSRSPSSSARPPLITARCRVLRQPPPHLRVHARAGWRIAREQELPARRRARRDGVVRPSAASSSPWLQERARRRSS